MSLYGDTPDDDRDSLPNYRRWEPIRPTPAQDVAARLSVPVRCGWKGCEDVVFGVQPFPSAETRPYPMQVWEGLLSSHDQAAHHRYRKIAEVSTPYHIPGQFDNLDSK